MEMITLKCSYCGKTFTKVAWIFRKNQKRSPNFKDIVCSNKECVARRKQEVYRTMVKKNKESGHYINNANKRRGKKIEEIFGEEIGKRTRDKIKFARLKQKDPRIGTTHSKKSKEEMSRKHTQYIKEHPEVKEQHGKKIKEIWKNKDPKERERIREACSERCLHRNWKNSCKTGYVKYWYSNDRAYFESSYEEKYFNKLNSKKKYWKKNTIIKIPYKHPKDGEVHFYIPDILIYDKGLQNLTRIEEVKPKEFLLDNGKEYNNICIAKIKALRNFGKANSLKIRVITERNL
jgi:hypothetical protein